MSLPRWIFGGALIDGRVGQSLDVGVHADENHEWRRAMQMIVSVRMYVCVLVVWPVSAYEL